MTSQLRSTLTGLTYPLTRRQEFAANGESLEVVQAASGPAQPVSGPSAWQRFAGFLPPDLFDPAWSLGEGDTPLLPSPQLAERLEVSSVLLKMESMNPTWSFKDRGSLPCVAFAKSLGEPLVATISTGNMGASIAAYAARAGLRALIFIPSFCPAEKIRAMAIHGATIVRVKSPDYVEMKQSVLGLADSHGLRVVSGNGPIRVEGYKFLAFELYEQLSGDVPDYIAVPTSACGHIRGIFKGYRELQAAGLIDRLPRMIIVQAANNSPLVTAFRQGKRQPVPFSNFHTIAEAITTGNPPGGDEVLDKAYEYGWLAASATEAEILEGQRELAEAGFFVEPASATSLAAVRSLRSQGLIDGDARVVMVMTGSGLKDSDVFQAHQMADIVESTVDTVGSDVERLLG